MLGSMMSTPEKFKILSAYAENHGLCPWGSIMLLSAYCLLPTAFQKRNLNWRSGVLIYQPGGDFLEFLSSQ